METQIDGDPRPALCWLGHHSYMPTLGANQKHKQPLTSSPHTQIIVYQSYKLLTEHSQSQSTFNLPQQGNDHPNPTIGGLPCVLQQHTPIHAAIILRQGRTDYANDLNRTRRTHEVPFIAGCRHLTRKNTRFRAPASSPKQTPRNIHAAITMRFAATHTHPCSHYFAKGEPITLETIQTTPAAHTRYLSSPAAAT